jgi:hypothetical protein
MLLLLLFLLLLLLLTLDASRCAANCCIVSS